MRLTDEPPPSRVFATICTLNYLPMASVLMKSLQEHHPEADRVILVTDLARANAQLAALCEFASVMSLSDLDGDTDSLRRRSFYYDVVEFCTSLKPTLLQILRKSYQWVTYVDPDIQFFARDDCLEVYPDRTGSCFVTPHRLYPPPMDALVPQERLFLTYGSLNLGYITVGPGSEALLDWWSSRLEFFSRNRPALAEFTDQKWFDLGIIYFPMQVIRHEGYNVAPWNLDERPLQAAPDGLKVGGEPLVFVHFSGFRHELASGDTRPRQPSWRSAIYGDRCDVYEALSLEWALQVASLDQGRGSQPYGFGRFPDGRRIRQWDRRAFWTAARASALTGGPPPKVPISSRRSIVSWSVELLLRSLSLRVAADFIREDARRGRRLIRRMMQGVSGGTR